MEKTKLGLSVQVVSVLAFLLFLFGGYVPGLLLVGFVLICETNVDLKKTVVTALLLMIAFSAISTAINLLPNIYNAVVYLFRVFDEHPEADFVVEIFGFLDSALNLIKTFTFVVVVVRTILGKPLKLAFLDKWFT